MSLFHFLIIDSSDPPIKKQTNFLQSDPQVISFPPPVLKNTLIYLIYSCAKFFSADIKKEKEI